MIQLPPSIEELGFRLSEGETFPNARHELLRARELVVADREDALRVKRLILEKVAFEDQGSEIKVASLGNDGWPFPIPLVLENGRWRFGVEAGREEIEGRRIGRNELLTLTTLHECVDAQREYFAGRRDGNPHAYAQKVISTEGRRDGLYWPDAEGEPESPLGPQAAAAAKEGYRPSGEGPFPFHGYYYRTLTAQGKSAPGGAKSYVNAEGLMTGGFALLAWPAKYGSSGVMTFQVSDRGIVFQKDPGSDTDAAVDAITAYDPDETWTPTGD